MEILINSKHTRKIIIESSIKGMSNGLKESYEFVKEILKKSQGQIGENLTFLVTWGASIGGMIRPLNDFINKKHVELNDMEISLILTGIIANYYLDNKELLNKIIKKIKEDGLFEVFNQIYSKSEELKKAFISFIESLNITGHKMSNIMSYAFIIPLIPIIFDGIFNNSLSENDAMEIAERLSAFGLVTISGLAIKHLIQKIINRFKSKQI